MKNYISIILLCFSLCSCEKEEMRLETSIVGKTFSNQSLSLRSCFEFIVR